MVGVTGLEPVPPACRRWRLGFSPYGVHEDKLRALPPERHLEDWRVECQLETVPVVGLAHGLETLGEPLGIAAQPEKN